MTVLADFAVESLGIEYPESFVGYGLGPSSEYKFCAYGIGDTEAEALDDCIEMMVQAGGFDLTEADEKRIKDAYGDCDDSTTVAEALDLDEDSVESGYDEQAWFHVGIKWNEKPE